MGRKFSPQKRFSGKLAVATHTEWGLWRRLALLTKHRFRESQCPALLRPVVGTSAEISGVWVYIPGAEQMQRTAPPVAGHVPGGVVGNAGARSAI
jgi:hypothetical protein